MSYPYNKLGHRKQLILRKIEGSSPEYAQWKTHIDNAFNDPSNYFKSSINGKLLIIGKKADPNKLSKIPVNVGRKSLFQMKGMKANLSSNKSINRIHSVKSSSTLGVTGNNNNRLSQLPPNKRYIDDIELNDIFDKYKTISPQDHNITSSELVAAEHIKTRNSNNSYRFSTELSTKEMNRIFDFQERAWFTYRIQQKEIENIGKHLSHSISRPTNKLLMTKTDGFRQKKEIKDFFNEEREEKSQKPPYKWIMDLRDKEEHYVNMGSSTLPQWQLIYYPHWAKETIRKPNIIPDDLFLKTYTTNWTTTGTNELEVNGKNLWQFEIENAKNLKGRKIITNEAKTVFNMFSDEEVFSSNRNIKDLIRRKGKSTIC